MNISKLLVTNCRTEPSSNQKKLEQHLELFKNASFFHQNQWPLANDSTNTSHLSPLFDKHSYETYLYNNPLATKTGQTLPESLSAGKALHSYYTMTTDSLKKVSNKNEILFRQKKLFILNSMQNMILGILVLKVFISILHQPLHRNQFD